IRYVQAGQPRCRRGLRLGAVQGEGEPAREEGVVDISEKKGNDLFFVLLPAPNHLLHARGFPLHYPLLFPLCVFSFDRILNGGDKTVGPISSQGGLRARYPTRNDVATEREREAAWYRNQGKLKTQRSRPTMITLNENRAACYVPRRALRGAERRRSS